MRRVGLKYGWDQTWSWMHSSPPQLDMAACPVYRWLQTEPHYSQRWEMVKWDSVAHLFSNFASCAWEHWWAQVLLHSTHFGTQIREQQVLPHMTHNIVHPENRQNRHGNMRKFENNEKILSVNLVQRYMWFIAKMKTKLKCAHQYAQTHLSLEI